MLSILSKSRIVAAPGFNRWLVPPAALAIHLSIGMAYGFSVFWLPLSRAIGVTAPAPGDWRVSTLGWMYTLFFVFLGSSAAVFGRVGRARGAAQGRRRRRVLLGRRLPASRRSASTRIRSGCCGLAAGVIGGCGLGLGYISPVSTLIKWFPDRRGHGDRPGDHGIRRRRDDRHAAREPPDESLRDADSRSACGRRSS